MSVTETFFTIFSSFHWIWIPSFADHCFKWIRRHCNLKKVAFWKISKGQSNRWTWEIHLHFVSWENLTLWNNIKFLPQKSFLIDLWIFHPIVWFPLTLYIWILTVFQPQFLSRIHNCQKPLTIHWMTEPSKHTIFCIGNNDLIMDYFFSCSISHFHFKAAK